MTQFVMVSDTAGLRLPAEARVRPLTPQDALLEAVAREHFGSSEGCGMLVDASGASESLVDAAWEAQLHGRDVADTALARVAAQLIQRGVGFVCWHADDSHRLPVVDSWDGFLAELRRQTKVQPADLWVRFQPPGRFTK
jgi:hypothetical protein